MSKISLSPSPTGSAVYTIASPAGSTDRTLTLPDTTAPILAGSGITLSASAPANTLVTNASGNVGIGIAAPLQRFTAVNAGITGGGPATSGSAADPNAVTRFQYGEAVTDFGAYASGAAWIQNRGSSNYASNYNMVLQPNGGFVGIGVSNPSTKLAVAGRTTLLGNNEKYAMQLNYGTTLNGPFIGSDGADIFTISASSGSEFVRVAGTGNMAIGTTDPGGARLHVTSQNATSGTFAIYAQNSSGQYTCQVRGDGGFSTGVAPVSPYNLTTGNAANVFVDSSGFLYRSTSSLKYKTDVQDASHGLAELLTLRSVTYKSNRADASGNVPDVVYGGLIAEEVHEAGLTEFVQYADDGTPDALAYGNMVSLCVKAIQELNAKVDAQAAEIAALKGQA